MTTDSVSRIIAVSVTCLLLTVTSFFILKNKDSEELSPGNSLTITSVSGDFTTGKAGEGSPQPSPDESQRTAAVLESKTAETEASVSNDNNEINREASPEKGTSSDYGENFRENTVKPQTDSHSSLSRKNGTPAKKKTDPSSLRKHNPPPEQNKNNRKSSDNKKRHTSQKNINNQDRLTRPDNSQQNTDENSRGNISGNTSQNQGATGESGSSDSASGSTGTPSNEQFDKRNKAYGILLSHARRLHVYPGSAVRRGIEGSGRILVVIDTSGRVAGYSVSRSTGNHILDESMKKTGSGLIGINTGITGENIRVEIPLSFRLHH